jgi:DNA-binding MarR family transcriptional regulator
VDNTTMPFQRLLGQTEKTLNAILDRQLAGVVNEPQWVALVLIASISAPGNLEHVTAQVAGALKTDLPTAADHIAQLADKGLVRTVPEAHPDVALSEAGRQLLGGVQSRVGEITQRLWGDLPASEMDAARRVLGTVLDRAHAELAAQS